MKKYLPLVSVIILNWNGRNFIERCLDSVIQTDYAKLEIIVVDNGSIDGSQCIIERKYPNVVLIKNKENVGFSKGNNIGILKSRGDIVILLNNDTIVQKNWVKEIVKYSSDPKVGIIGCILLLPNGNLLQSQGCIEKFLGFWEHVGAGSIYNNQYKKLNLNFDYVSGAAFGIKKSVIKRIGLLDPIFGSYVEEVDWCYRAKRVGYKIVVSDGVVYHYVSASWGNFPLKQFYLTYRNKLLFIQKNYPQSSLLRYLFEYPIKLTTYSLLSFLNKKTATQKISIVLNKKVTFIDFIKKFFFNISFFYLTLFPRLKKVKKWKSD